MLGILGMIDEGEMDWKVIGIAVDDPLADKVNNVEDLEKVSTYSNDWLVDI